METKWTKGPWSVGKRFAVLSEKRRTVNANVMNMRLSYQEKKANAHLTAAAPDLYAVAENFEIKGPDADGDVWLVLHGTGTDCKAMFNLGNRHRIAAQLAIALELERHAATKKARGEK